MRDEVYKNIMKILRSVTQDSVPHSRRCMEILHKAYPQIPELTLESIYTLYYQRRMRMRHFKCKEMAKDLYHRYNAAVANGESGILLRMSLEFDLAPALLARLILDQHFMSEDNKFNKYKCTVLVRNDRQPNCKIHNVSEKSSSSNSLSETRKSSDNTVCEVSEDLSVEESSEESKLSDILSHDAQNMPESVISEVHKDNGTMPAECECSLSLALQNGNVKSQSDERVKVSGHVNTESTVRSNERLPNPDHASSVLNGCPNSSQKCTADACSELQRLQDVSSVDQMTKCKSTEKVDLDAKGRILGEPAQLTETCRHPTAGRSEVTAANQESCCNSLIEATQKTEESFRDELQDLKNKLIELKMETKMLKTDRPTASDEAGIEFSGMKRSISRLMKDTTLIQDKILAHEVSMCVLYDDQYGPAATTYKHSLGQEYEVKLIRHAKAADLTFHLEARLRERGFDKTPDLLLIYPIAIGCNVVNWIESKALFADREVHSMYFVHQYERYCSRYGPGLVIYWFGFVESLREDDPFILVRDNFPKYIKHMNLLVDDASDGEADEENVGMPDWEVVEPSSEEMTKFLERFSS